MTSPLLSDPVALSSHSPVTSFNGDLEVHSLRFALPNFIHFVTKASLNPDVSTPQPLYHSFYLFRNFLLYQYHIQIVEVYLPLPSR